MNRERTWTWWNSMGFRWSLCHRQLWPRPLNILPYQYVPGQIHTWANFGKTSWIFTKILYSSGILWSLLAVTLSFDLWSQKLISTPTNADTSVTKIQWNSIHASMVFGVIILSIHLSHVLCDKTKPCTADILIPHQRAMILVFWHQHGGQRPLLSAICAQSDPPPSKNADFGRFPHVTSQL